MRLVLCLPGVRAFKRNLFFCLAVKAIDHHIKNSTDKVEVSKVNALYRLQVFRSKEIQFYENLGVNHRLPIFG